MNKQRGCDSTDERGRGRRRVVWLPQSAAALAAVGVVAMLSGFALAAAAEPLGTRSDDLEQQGQTPDRNVNVEDRGADGADGAASAERRRVAHGGPWGMWLWHPELQEGRLHRGSRPGDRSESERGDRPRVRELPWDREPDAEEWAQTIQFLSDHAPRRLAMYQQLEQRLLERAREEDPEEPGVDPDAAEELPRSVRALRLRMHMRVQGLEELREENPSLYEFSVEQFALEDEIVAALYDARSARMRGDTAREVDAHSYATAALRQYLDNVMEEREARIEGLRAELEREEARLARDRERTDELIQRLRQRFERFLPPPESESVPRGRTRTDAQEVR